MLRGKHVYLSPLEPADSETLFRWINEAELVRLNAPYRPVAWSAHTEWFASAGRDPSTVVFAIRRAVNDGLVGVVQLIHIHSVHRSTELTIRIGAGEDRDRGYGTEAVELAKRFAFEDLNLERLYLHVFADNSRAIRVYEKAGLVREGQLRRAAYIHGKWTDVVVMACLRDKT